MTWVTWIANTGGLMGLCMGLSFVSVAEILYYLARLCGGCFGIGKDKEEEQVEELAKNIHSQIRWVTGRWGDRLSQFWLLDSIVYIWRWGLAGRRTNEVAPTSNSWYCQSFCEERAHLGSKSPRCHTYTSSCILVSSEMYVLSLWSFHYSKQKKNFFFFMYRPIVVLATELF